MSNRVVVLGAGFGGLELSTVLSEALGDAVDVTLIDRSDAFSFGFSKLDVMFGKATADGVRMHYRDIVKPGVRFVQETITAIDPTARSVTTDAGSYEADYLVIALGADYDLAATPGLADGAHEFYSFAGAAHVRDVLPTFEGGRAVVGVCAAPFKCPPAPSECVLLLHDMLVQRGIRDACELKIVIPFPTPVPPSPDTSAALVQAFAERDIEFVAGRRIASVDPTRNVAVLDDGSELPFDLLLAVPRHQAPDVVIASGITVDGYIPVDGRTLATGYENVWAVGDCATVGVPKAGVFSEAAARVVARNLISLLRGDGGRETYDGTGSCYIEFGEGRVGRVDVDFFSGPTPTGTFQEPSAALVADKTLFGSSRKARWFGT